MACVYLSRLSRLCLQSVKICVMRYQGKHYIDAGISFGIIRGGLSLSYVEVQGDVSDT